MFIHKYRENWFDLETIIAIIGILFISFGVIGFSNQTLFYLSALLFVFCLLHIVENRHQASANISWLFRNFSLLLLFMFYGLTSLIQTALTEFYNSSFNPNENQVFVAAALYSWFFFMVCILYVSGGKKIKDLIFGELFQNIFCAAIFGYAFLVLIKLFVATDNMFLEMQRLTNPRIRLSVGLFGPVNPNFIASFLTIMYAIIALYQLYNVRKRFVLSLASLLTSFLIGLTYSFTAALSLLLMNALFFVAFEKSCRVTVFSSTLLLCFGFFLTSSNLGHKYVAEKVGYQKNILTTLGALKGSSGNARLELGRYAIEKWKSKPYFGYGFGKYIQVIVPRERRNLAYSSTHNIFLYVLLHGGLVGVALAFLASIELLSKTISLARAGQFAPITFILASAPPLTLQSNWIFGTSSRSLLLLSAVLLSTVFLYKQYDKGSLLGHIKA